MRNIFNNREVKTMMTDKDKLAHILHHWTEHNDAHIEEYRKWADTAGREGLDEVQRFILEAVKSVEDANGALHKAMKVIGH